MKVKPLIQGFQSVFCKLLMVTNILSGVGKDNTFFIVILRHCMCGLFFTAFSYTVTVHKQWWVKTAGMDQGGGTNQYCK